MNFECEHIAYTQTNAFSNLVYDYIAQKHNLTPFYQFSPTFEGVQKAIQERAKFEIDRALLLDVLKSQYAQLEINERVRDNIISLSSTQTFTICTAHQPNLLTGYLYFFYKILHTIQAADTLNKQHSDKHFVPIFFIGSEDDDLDELGQFWYQNRKYQWDAHGQTGAVGRMKTKELENLLSILFNILGPPGVYCDTLIKTIKSAYLNQTTIGKATQCLVNSLFGHYGLLIIDPDDYKLKASFTNIIKDELLNHNSFRLATTQTRLLSDRYKAQAHPREINLFYLKDNIRERIERENDTWKVLNTSISFNKAELLQEVDNHPDRFSPNVILRGVFQESILPNISFVGGGSELAYWLQLKPIFEYYNVFYPVLLLRQSVQIIPLEASVLMDKLHLRVVDIFNTPQAILQNYITQKKGNIWSLEIEKNKILTIADSIIDKATISDTTLAPAVKAAMTRINNEIKTLEKKLYRSEKRKESIASERIQSLKEIIYPNGKLQERIENFIPYYLGFGFSIFDKIKNEIKPFDNKFLVLSIRNK